MFKTLLLGNQNQQEDKSLSQGSSHRKHYVVIPSYENSSEDLLDNHIQHNLSPEYDHSYSPYYKSLLSK